MTVKRNFFVPYRQSGKGYFTCEYCPLLPKGDFIVKTTITCCAGFTSELIDRNWISRDCQLLSVSTAKRVEDGKQNHKAPEDRVREDNSKSFHNLQKQRKES